MEGTYLLASLIILAFVAWPDQTVAVLTSVSLKIQVYFLNLRMRWAAWRVYRQLVRMTKEAGFPHPGPFSYTDLWDRQ